MSPNKLRKCIVVLGMHRSGTSLAAGILRILGIDFGENLMGSAESNERGHFEHNDIYRINELILKDLDSSWDDISDLPDLWHKNQSFVFYKEEIKNIINRDFGVSKIFGIKDPRISILLPLYLDIFSELNIKPLFVIISRDASEISKSLEKRDNFSFVKSLNLVAKYERSIEKFTEDEKKVYISFADLVNYPKFCVEKIKDNLQIPLKNYDTFESDLVRFVDPRLKHHNLSADGLVKDLFVSLDAFSENLKQKEREIKEKDLRIEQHRREIESKDRYIFDLESQIQVKNSNIENLESQIQDKNSNIENLSKNILDLNFSMHFFKQEVLALKKSTSYKFSQYVERLLFSFILKNNMTRTAYLRIVEKMQNFFNGSKEKKSEKLARNNLDGGKKDFKIIDFHSSENPEVSIIIPVYNNWLYTYCCLESILKNTLNVDYEIIIADDFSGDTTVNIKEFVKNIKVVRNKKNLGFLQNCNNGADFAKGRHLLFLNNDTIVHKNSILNLLKIIKGSKDVGAVGGKIVLPDGTLQEAGSIIWQDGSTCGYGRGDNPQKPEYNFLREVDYCSGAFLLVRKDLFFNFGKFDILYSPAYYEEVDLCMKLRQNGYKVLYQPLSEITHYEFKSGSEEAIIKLQLINRKTFFNKWKKILLNRHGSLDEGTLSHRTFGDRKKILYIDDRVPDPKLGSGFPRSYNIVSILNEMGLQVTFFPAVYPNESSTVSLDLQQKGVEVICGVDGRGLNFEEFFSSRKSCYNAVFISRPHNMESCIDIIKKYNSSVKIIYDAEALFSMRDINFDKINGNNLKEKDIEYLLKKEVNLCSRADIIIVVSEGEKRIFEKYGAKNIFVISHGVELRPTAKNFNERDGLLFVGGILSEEKNPNFDAMQYFLDEIFPLIREEIDCTFYFVGTNRSEAIKKLGNKSVKIVGSVEDLHQYYNDSRVFVVPTRFSAGIPLKAIEAASYGIPIVMSELSKNQLGWNDGEECLAADSSQNFADKVVMLYSDEKLWESIKKNSLKKIEEEHNIDDMVKKLKNIFVILIKLKFN